MSALIESIEAGSIHDVIVVSIATIHKKAGYYKEV